MFFIPFSGCTYRPCLHAVLPQGERAALSRIASQSAKAAKMGLQGFRQFGICLSFVKSSLESQKTCLNADFPDFYIVSPCSELFSLSESKGTFFQNFRIFSKT